MAKVIYKTKDECVKAIQTVKALGMEPADWMLEQLKRFENEESNKIVKSGTPIWDTLKANYPYGTMPEEKKKCVEDAVNQLLETGPHAEEPGLLLGKIQCGKTDTFEDIIGLAFDKGVDIAIVITKGTKALVNQTIQRMKHDYRFFKASDSLNQQATINIYDIMKIWRNLKLSRVEGCKTVIVGKKEATNLDHLIEMFKANDFLQNKKVLIVDDEADFASRNYRSVKVDAATDENGNPIPQKRESEMAKISQMIDDFRKIPKFCRYLQVTATPYSLYLQPSGELNLNGQVVMPFKPRFTCLVPVHDKYIGGKEYFVDSQDPDSMYSHLYHQIDKKCIDVMGHEDKRYLKASVSSANIYGLTYALVAYFMATAIRRIQERENGVDYKTSAVIHVEIDKHSHDWQRRMIERLIESIEKAVVDEDQTDQRIWTAINVNYKDFCESNRKGREQHLIKVEMPSLDDVMDEIRNIFNPKRHDYAVQTVNSDEDMSSLLDEETGELQLDCAANIFIGGNILDRGITVKHMLCFFYGRNPKNFQQDTVLQHARMYGARSKEDMAVTRFHTTDAIYHVLARMNELDEQLRQWFIEGKDKEEPNAVFVGYDNHIKPCAAQKIKVSNALTIRPQHRVVPSGFWTGNKREIGSTVDKITNLIVSSPGYKNQDENGFFEMDEDLAMEILNLIASTYVYNRDLDNLDHRSDLKEMMCNLEYCSDHSDGKIYVIHRTGRNMTRLRANGGYIDAPDDGRTDTAPSRAKAINEPVLMLIQENGSKQKDEETGENIGWNNAPFYWPVFMPQQNISPVMFAMDQESSPEVRVIDYSDIIAGLDKKDILSLTYSGDLIEHFGEEGSEYTPDNFPEETRSLKESTVGKYLEKETDGSLKLNPDVKFDKENDHGLYSLNNGFFPFVLKPYKYMLLTNGRTAHSDVMLMELADMNYWQVIPEGELNNDGDLVDRDTGAVIAHGTDTLLDEDFKGKDFVDKTLTQWTVIYPIKKVLKFRGHLETESTEDVE